MDEEKQDSLLVLGAALGDKHNSHNTRRMTVAHAHLEDEDDGSSTDPTTSVDSCQGNGGKEDIDTDRDEREETSNSSVHSTSLSDGNSDDPGLARNKNRVTTLSLNAGLSMSDDEEVGVVLNSIIPTSVPSTSHATAMRFKHEDAAPAVVLNTNTTIGQESTISDLPMSTMLKLDIISDDIANTKLKLDIISDDVAETNGSSEGKENSVEHANATQTPHRKELGDRGGGAVQIKVPMTLRSSPHTTGAHASLPPPSPSMNGNRLKPPPLALLNSSNARPSVVMLSAARSFEDVACFGTRSPSSSSSINLRIHPPSQKVHTAPAPITKMPANAKDTNYSGNNKMSPRKSQSKTTGTIEHNGATGASRGAFAARAAAKKERDAADYQGAMEAAKSAPSLPVDDVHVSPLESEEIAAQAKANTGGGGYMSGVAPSQTPNTEIFGGTGTVMSQSVEVSLNETLQFHQTRDFDEEFTLPPPESTESALASKKVQEMIVLRSDPDQEEQAIFESKLAEDPNGIAIRKINSSGKSQLRFVKCIGVSDSSAVSSKKRFSSAASIQSSMSLRSGGARSVSRSVGLSTTKKRLHLAKSATASHGVSRSVVSATTEDDMQSHTLLSSALSKRRRALTWGNKTKVAVGVEKFTCVKKGKSTDRTRRSASPATHLLSVLTDDINISLDIEAPTQSDRDKFAKAFARFLSVPLVSESETLEERVFVKANGASVAAPTPSRNGNERRKKMTNNRMGSAHTAPDSMLYNHSNSLRVGVSSSISVDASEATGPGVVGEIPSLLSPIQSFSMRDESKSFSVVEEDAEQPEASIEVSGIEKVTSTQDVPDHPPNTADRKRAAKNDILGMKDGAMQDFIDADAVTPTRKESSPVRGQEKEDDHSTVSSLTAGFEHEIVDELHQVIQELRTELEASRAEAGRAVKVAEQAIQSAESCNSNDWNSTVTHKAAEVSLVCESAVAVAF
jgi:hypothetical protein